MRNITPQIPCHSITQLSALFSANGTWRVFIKFLGSEWRPVLCCYCSLAPVLCALSLTFWSCPPVHTWWTGTGWASPWQWWWFHQWGCRWARRVNGTLPLGHICVSVEHFPAVHLGPCNTTPAAVFSDAPRCSWLRCASRCSPSDIWAHRSTKRTKTDSLRVLDELTWNFTSRNVIQLQRFFLHFPSPRVMCWGGVILS